MSDWADMVLACLQVGTDEPFRLDTLALSARLAREMPSAPGPALAALTEMAWVLSVRKKSPKAGASLLASLELWLRGHTAQPAFGGEIKRAPRVGEAVPLGAVKLSSMVNMRRR